MTDAIERIHCPTADEFMQYCTGCGEPAIVTGVVPEWPAFARWNIELLRAEQRETVLAVSRDARGEWRHDTEHYVWTDMVDLLERLERGGSGLLALQVPILELAPWVLDEIRLPRYFARRSLLGINLWLQGVGSRSHLHWDGTPGLLALIQGEKRVQLFSPEQGPHLYPAPAKNGEANWSEVDVFRLDTTRFPEFRRAQPRTVTLRPGEMLFIPRHHWHAVETTELSISVNFWWRSRLGDRSPFYADRTHPEAWSD